MGDSGVFDLGQHLSQKDVEVDNSERPTQVSLRIKQSKTDLFSQGAMIFLHRTGQSLWPVAAW